MGCTPPFSSFLFLGCTWASSLSLSGMHPHQFPFFVGFTPPFEGYPHLLIPFFFFFKWDTLTHLLCFSRAHPHNSFSFCGMHSPFYPGSTHTSAPPAFFWDALMHLLLLFCRDSVPTSSFFWDAPLPPPLIFLQNTITQVLLLWDGLTDVSLFFFSGCLRASFFFPFYLQGPVVPRPTGNHSLHFLKDSNSSTCPKAGATHTHPKTSTEDISGKISREGIWGREQSHFQAWLSLGNASQSNPTPAALI